jgi:hypothetical protein
MAKTILVPRMLLFINVGVETKKQYEDHINGIKLDTLRKWENSKKFGFISGGQSIKWKNQICKVEIGDIICAYVTGYGFVGIGECISAPQPIKEFKTKDKKYLKGVDLITPTYIMELNISDMGLCDYAFGVKWFDGLTFPKEKAKSVVGKNLGITQHIRTDLAKNKIKMKFIQEAFDVKFLFS